MLFSSLQNILIFISISIVTEAKKPPGYVEPPKIEDPNPPKYEYGYKISDEKGTEQAKEEQRDGIYASGRYYVQGTESSQNIEYFADDWGYHPVVEYSSIGPHSRSGTKFALGEEAVKQLKNKENGSQALGDPTETKQFESPNSSTISSNPSRPDRDPVSHNVISKDKPTVEGNNNDEQKLDQNNTHHEPQPNFFQPANPLHQLQEQSQPLIFFPQPIILQADNNHQPVPLPLQLNSPPPSDQIFYQQQLHENPQQVVFLQQNPQENLINSEPNRQNVLIQHQIFHSQGSSENKYEFGTKLNVREEQLPNRLIESTKDLVSGADVLNINEVISSRNTETQEKDSKYNLEIVDTPIISSSTPSSQFQYSISTPSPISDISLSKQPIVVAEKDETEDHNQRFVSTTASSIESLAGITDSERTTTILVTPKSVSTNFLESTSGEGQLQNGEQHSEEAQQIQQYQKQQVQVDIQKSLPYYLGKYEYPLSYANEQKLEQNSTDTDIMMSQVREDIELGKTLLYLPGNDHPDSTRSSVQQPPSLQVKQKFTDVSSNQISSHQISSTLKDNYADNNKQQVQIQQVPFQKTKTVITQVLRQSHPPQVPTQPSYSIVKQQEPYRVEQFVNRPTYLPPVVISQNPTFRIPYRQPYSVETAKQPYFVLPYYGERKVPFPVDERVPIPYIFPVEQTRPGPRLQYNVLYPKPLLSTNFNVLPIQYLPSDQHNQQSQHQLSPVYSNPYAYAPQVNKYLPPKQESSAHRGYLPPKVPKVQVPQHANNGYLPPVALLHNQDNDNLQPASSINYNTAYIPLKQDNYVGLLPPKNNDGLKDAGKYRTARSNFDDKSVRLEYGFMPPLIPSLEIDENGQPIERDDNKS